MFILLITVCVAQVMGLNGRICWTRAFDWPVFTYNWEHVAGIVHYTTFDSPLFPLPTPVTVSLHNKLATLWITYAHDTE